MWRGYTDYSDRFVTYVRLAQGRPSWVIRLTLAAMVLTVVIPLAVLALTALFVGAVVFIVLSLVATIVNALGDVFGGSRARRHDGRDNVRVIEPD